MLVAGLRSRGVAYLSVVGTVVALLAAGLAVPFLFGHPDSATRASGFAVGGPAASGSQTPGSAIPGSGSLTGGSAAAASGGGGFGPPSSQSSRPGSAAGGPTGAGAARATGPLAPGVSDHQIRLGIPIFNVGNLPVNGINPAQQEAQWN
ncbi:MAG: hypothetical protein JO265_12150, partial [Acidimicrobiia bacterium]|nr:hypothetical protein [Acidimicrobiia bacterium]